MSDPVSNAEVEDVLSSIRRLVSEEKRTPVEATPSATANDRLVLTPALRVAEDNPQIDDASTFVTVDEAESSPEFENVAVAHDTALDQADGIPKDLDDTDQGADIKEPVDLGGEEARLDRDWDVRQNNVDEIADDEAETVSFSEEADVSATETDTQSLDDNHQQDEVAKDDQLTEEPVEVTVAEAEPVDAFAHMSSTASLGAKIAALETVVGRTDDQWEPDDPGNSDYAGTEAPSMTWEDTETADEPSLTPAAEDVFGSAEDILDEEALRDLVSDIVREELQGALGERITRNVRKLVRREIHRALAAQELE